MTETATDTAPAEIGHNVPPPFDQAAVDELAGKVQDFAPVVQDFADAAGAWLDKGEIEGEEQAQKLNDFVTGCRGLWRKIEAERKTAKQPHLDAGAAVDNLFKALLGPLAKAAERVKPLLSRFAIKKAEAEAKAKREAQAAADALAAEAEKLAKAAAKRHDVVGEAEAEERQKAAEKAQRDATRTSTTGQIASATGGGRTAALRTYYSAEITGPRQAVVWALTDHPSDMLALVERLANADKRADKTLEIPGIKFTKEMRLA